MRVRIIEILIISVTRLCNWIKNLKSLVESRRFEIFIVTLIVINAITLGLETDSRVMEAIGPLLIFLDKMVLTIFVLEVLIKVCVYRLRFFKDPWRIFDLLVVGISLLPATGNLSVLRALRILRVLRLISVVPSLRKVVGGLVAALPGMGSITLLLLLVFYVFSVMATKLYGGAFPDWFGSIGDSAYSLFQIMTLESWSMGIVRPVMQQFPLAWIFFIVFILCTSFTVLNLFIGIIVSAMQSETEDSAHQDREQLIARQDLIMQELKSIRQIIDRKT